MIICEFHALRFILNEGIWTNIILHLMIIAKFIKEFAFFAKCIC